MNITARNGEYVISGLDENLTYIATKWYGNSLAIFEETAFRKYINRLDTDFKENGHGQSVIRFFLSAAVTMLPHENDLFVIPEELAEYIDAGDELPVIDICPHIKKYSDCFPYCLLVSAENLDAAIKMTKQRHA